ncbi:MAG: DUF488 family protein [Chloroflexi bacterium]|nr:DUF488 family protein [Chloroflexota bacterium]
MLKIKRVYETKEAKDGTRILVDRLWPRGLSRLEAHIDQWAKEVAPSQELRQWFAHQSEKWPEFKERYERELSTPEKSRLLEQIALMAGRNDVTLLYAARDSEYNNAVVLGEILAKLMKDLPQS